MFNISAASLSGKTGPKKKKTVKKGSKTKVALERVIGCTASDNSVFVCNPVTGDVAYPAGSVVVVYNPKRNKQVFLLNNKSGKPVSSLCFSSKGNLLAVGESGHQPSIIVWDIGGKAATVASEFKGHSFGIACMSFSPNGKYIASMGLQHDGLLNFWEWKTGALLASNKLTTKVCSLSFAEDGTYFVTSGVRHVKFWLLDPLGNIRAADKAAGAKKAGGVAVLEGKSGVLGIHKDSTFHEAVCGRGSSKSSVLAVTSKFEPARKETQSFLCSFNAQTRLIDKWVNLKASGVYAMSVTEKSVCCACSDGILRLFDPVTLEYQTTLPRPPALGREFLGTDSITSLPIPHGPNGVAADQFADSVACRLSVDNTKLAVLYSDRSFFIWDIKNLKKIGKYRSFQSHSACIWDIDVFHPAAAAALSGPGAEMPFPPNTFVTCSADNTIRFWNLDELPPTKGQRNLFSRELLRTIYVGDDFSGMKIKDAPDLPSRVGESGIRCVKISPDGQFIASGDRQGNLRVHELHTLSCRQTKEAHDAEILCLDFSRSNGGAASPLNLLASGSRDRLLHIYDINRDYETVETLDDHSSSITAVKFAVSGSRLLSSSADKSILFRSISATTNSVLSIARYHQAIAQFGTVYDMDVDVTNKYIVTSGQEKRLNIYSIATGKITRSYKADESAELIKVQMDPAGLYVATSGSDKMIRLYDFYSGDCISKVSGHSEVVTGLKFTPDCQRLISISGDGCIFVWLLSADITKNMQERLGELYHTPQPPSQPAAAAAAVAAGPAPSGGIGGGIIRPGPAASLLTNSGDGAKKVTPPAAAAVQDTPDFVFSSKFRPAAAAIPYEPPLEERFAADFGAPKPDQFRFSESHLPAWAKSKAPVSAGGPADAPVPKGKWAERATEAVITPFINPNASMMISDSIDPSSSLRWAEAPPRRFTSNPEEQDAPLVLESLADNSPTGTQPTPFVDPAAKAAAVAAPATAAKPSHVAADDDDDIVQYESGDESDDEQNEDEEEEPEIAYIPEPSAATQVFDSKVNSSSELSGGGGTLTASASEKKEEDEEAEDPNVKGEQFVDSQKADFLASNFESLVFSVPKADPMRLSVSGKFFSRSPTRPAAVSHVTPAIAPVAISSELSADAPAAAAAADAADAKPAKSLAQEVERTRQRLAQLGITLPSHRRRSEEGAAPAVAGPTVREVPVGSHPPLPEGTLAIALASATEMAYSDRMPVLECNGLRYWALSFRDNRPAMLVVAFDVRTNAVVNRWTCPGARYLHQIIVDPVSREVHFCGQNNQKVTLSWQELGIKPATAPSSPASHDGSGSTSSSSAISSSPAAASISASATAAPLPPSPVAAAAAPADLPSAAASATETVSAPARQSADVIPPEEKGAAAARPDETQHAEDDSALSPQSTMDELEELLDGVGGSETDAPTPLNVTRSLEGSLPRPPTERLAAPVAAQSIDFQAGGGPGAPSESRLPSVAASRSVSDYRRAFDALESSVNQSLAMFEELRQSVSASQIGAPSSEARAAFETFHNSLASVHERLGKSLYPGGVADRSVAESSSASISFANADLSRTLDTYSSLLLGLVREKLDNAAAAGLSFAAPAASTVGIQRQQLPQAATLPSNVANSSVAGLSRVRDREAELS